MNPALVTFLVQLITVLASDLAPLIEKIVEGAKTGRSPLEILAEEQLEDIIPPRWRMALVRAAAKSAYAPNEFHLPLPPHEVPKL